MVKFTAAGPDGPIIGLGISEGNVERLKAGQPILVDLKTMGFQEGSIMIFYGESNAAMFQELKARVGPHTLIIGEENVN